MEPVQGANPAGGRLGARMHLRTSRTAEKDLSQNTQGLDHGARNAAYAKSRAVIVFATWMK